MLARTGLSFVALAALATAPAHAEDTVKAMLHAALTNNNEAEINIIAKYARAAEPARAAEFEKLVDDWRIRKRAEEVAKAQLAAEEKASWKGRGELGGFFATGNTESVGISAGATFNQEDAYWRHTVIAQADYQESSGATTREHFLLSWQPRYKFSDRGYAYGLAQYEHDPFLGYDSRYSISGGVGIRAVSGGPLTLDVEAGPALRITDFVDGTPEETVVAGRGSLQLDWKLNPALSLTHSAAVYADRVNSTLTGTTAITAKVAGPLSARLSYNIQYESNPPVGRQTTDTMSRASLVYDF